MKRYLQAVLATVLIAAMVILPSYSFSSPSVKVGFVTQSNRNGSGNIVTR